MTASKPNPPFAAEPATTYLADAPTRHVRLFRNGANQALRIPRELELPGNEATIRKVGNTLVIEPAPVEPAKGTVAALLLALDEIRALAPCTDEFPDVDEGLLPLDDIVL